VSQLVRCMKQGLAGFLVVKGWMEPIRSEPALPPERIGHGRLQIRVLFKLWHEIDRRFLPPIHFARGEGPWRVPGVGDMLPDNLIEIRSLAAGRSARRFVAWDVLAVSKIFDLFAWLPVVSCKLERTGADHLLDPGVRWRSRNSCGHHERHVAA